MIYCQNCGKQQQNCQCRNPIMVERERRVPAGSSSVQRVDGWLTVPTEPAPCYIPIGMTEEDVQLLEASIKLWRDRLIRKETEKPPIVGMSHGEK